MSLPLNSRIVLWLVQGSSSVLIIDDISMIIINIIILVLMSFAFCNRTGQGRCAANMVRWKQSSDTRCSCGEIQTMSHIVHDCIETRFPGGLAPFAFGCAGRCPG